MAEGKEQIKSEENLTVLLADINNASLTPRTANQDHNNAIAYCFVIFNV